MLGSKFTRLSQRRAPVPWVAFLGADGSGKSTVIDGVERTFSAKSIIYDLIHWRPGLMATANSGDGSPVTDPHGKLPRGFIASVLKLLLLFFDWWSLMFRLAAYDSDNPKVLISDRFYRDIEIDPRRYRFGAARRLATMVNALMPKPDLVIVLVGDPATIHMRKKEVSLDELERQMSEYHQMALFLGSNAVEVDTTSSLEQTMKEVHAALLEHLPVVNNGASKIKG